jgi:CxxC-x17-CxxC domain-containing protein
MTFSSKALQCCTCSMSFIFSVDEQRFFLERGLVNEPRRCSNCRVLTRLKREGKDPETAIRLNCAQCGGLAVVPFKPTGCRPVYCGDCFHANQISERIAEKSQLEPALVSSGLAKEPD